MARWKRSLHVDIPSLFVVMLITASVLSLAGQGTAFACPVARVADGHDNAPSFGTIGRALILSVPEHANVSYVIAALKALDPQDGSNPTTNWSLTNDSSEAFSVIDGELRVNDSDKLQGFHIFKLTILAADGNRACNGSYVDVEVFVVDDVYDFVLPTSLPAAILTHNSQFVIQELGNILGFKLIQVQNENYASYDSSDSKRSYIAFQAFEIDTNATVRVSTSDIGMKIAEESDKISSLFQFLSSFLMSAGDSDASEYSLNALSKILVGVACLLVLIILAVVIKVCRLRKSCCRHGDSCEDLFSCYRQGDLCEDTLGCCTHNLSWSDNSCCRHRDSVTDETPLSHTNWSFNEGTERKSVPAFEFPEHMEPSGFTEISQSEKPPLLEVRKDTLSMAGESWSLGLNTVTRREHFLDRQMQKLQELFQALGDDLSQSEVALNPKLDNDDHQGELQLSLSYKQDTFLPGQRSTASEAAKASVAVTESSGTDISKPETQDSGSSKTQLYPRITLQEDGKLDFATIQPPYAVHQEDTLMLHAAGAELLLHQISPVDGSNEHPPLGESNTSGAGGFMPQKSASDVTNQNSSFEEINESQIPSSVTKDSEDEDIFTWLRKIDQNVNIQPPNPAKSQADKSSNAVLQITNRNMPLVNSTTSRTSSSFTEDHSHGHVTPIHRTDAELQLPHQVMSAADKLTQPMMSAADKLTQPMMFAADKPSHAAPQNAEIVVQEERRENKPNKNNRLFPTNAKSLDPLTELLHDEDVGDIFANESVGDILANENVGDILANENVREILANENVGDILANENMGDILANENVGDILANENVGDILANNDVGDSPADEDAVTHF